MNENINQNLEKQKSKNRKKEYESIETNDIKQ
jgi:hypothetical protein